MAHTPRKVGFPLVPKMHRILPVFAILGINLILLTKMAILPLFALHLLSRVFLLPLILISIHFHRFVFGLIMRFLRVLYKEIKFPVIHAVKDGIITVYIAVTSEFFIALIVNGSANHALHISSGYNV